MCEYPVSCEYPEGGGVYLLDAVADGLSKGRLDFNGSWEGHIVSAVPSIPTEHYHVEKRRHGLSTFPSYLP
jgi:hypothetical protein